MTDWLDLFYISPSLICHLLTAGKIFHFNLLNIIYGAYNIILHSQIHGYLGYVKIVELVTVLGLHFNILK